MADRDIYLLQRSEEFHLGAGQEASIDLKLKKAPPLPCTKLRGQVISGCRKISGATVKILGKDFKPVCHTETDQNGEFSFIDTLVPGDYAVVVSAEDYLVSEIRPISLMPFKLLYITIKLCPDKNARNTVVYGTVRNGENIPLPNVQVLIFRDGNRICPTNYTMTNADGEYLFTGLEPGEYVLSALSHGYILPEEITVKVLPKDIFCADIYLYRKVSAESGTVSGIILHDGHAVPYAVAALFHEESNGYSLIKIQKSNCDGVYLFSDLKPGEYIVTAKFD